MGDKVVCVGLVGVHGPEVAGNILWTLRITQQEGTRTDSTLTDLSDTSPQGELALAVSAPHAAAALLTAACSCRSCCL